jgi:hypothetical protein
LQVATSPCCHWSGRTMARIGLRMMPPFPSSPYHPYSGFSPVRLEGRCIRRCLTRRLRVLRDVWFASALRAPCCLERRILALSRGARCPGTPPFKRPLPLYPRGPRSGPGYAVPVHHHLSTPCAPLTSTSRFHRHGLYKMSSLCVQAATPRQPVSGSVLSWTVLCRHVIVCDPGKLVGCIYPVPSPTTLAFDQDP